MFQEKNTEIFEYRFFSCQFLSVQRVFFVTEVVGITSEAMSSSFNFIVVISTVVPFLT